MPAKVKTNETLRLIVNNGVWLAKDIISAIVSESDDESVKQAWAKVCKWLSPSDT